jgi:hypothetical protein
MKQLVDGDVAANNGGWQWTAGVGTDAAPYFRVFSPSLQGAKFDPDGSYVRAGTEQFSQANALNQDIIELTELLAENAHENWAWQRMSEGWSYGPNRDDAAKKHPCLVPYEDLPESERLFNRFTIALDGRTYPPSEIRENVRSNAEKTAEAIIRSCHGD